METGSRPDAGVFVAADVHYLTPGGARAAAVICADAGYSRPTGERAVLAPQVRPYEPGRFYLRELPALHAVLNGLTGMTLLVVDGFADLDPDGRPGLGARACTEFAIPVIGVVKSAFRTATDAIPVLRGGSARPLYVTAAGLPRTDAADLVRHMAGRHRMPTALRRADALARNGLAAAVASDGGIGHPGATKALEARAKYRRIRAAENGLGWSVQRLADQPVLVFALSPRPPGCTREHRSPPTRLLS
jgi:deoxyribonuclease V